MGEIEPGPSMFFKPKPYEQRENEGEEGDAQRGHHPEPVLRDPDRRGTFRNPFQMIPTPDPHRDRTHPEGPLEGQYPLVTLGTAA